VVLPAFDSMELISHDEHAQTYKASWQGCSVVVKKCDIWNERAVAKELKHEARIYQVLRTLQGRCIPKLKIAAVADGMEMVLVIDFVGTDISQVHLDESDKGKIRAALCAIHDLGVVHGDIRPQNILVQHHGSNAIFYFVDFGLSRVTANKNELLQETAILNSLLRNVATTRS
jgi:tRNA A-37 threonylcarbamoyl transferase component Bud32